MVDENHLLKGGACTTHTHTHNTMSKKKALKYEERKREKKLIVCILYVMLAAVFCI